MEFQLSDKKCWSPQVDYYEITCEGGTRSVAHIWAAKGDDPEALEMAQVMLKALQDNYHVVY